MPLLIIDIAALYQSEKLQSKQPDRSSILDNLGNKTHGPAQRLVGGATIAADSRTRAIQVGTGSRSYGA